MASEFAEHLAATGHQVSYVCCAATNAATNEATTVQTEEICGVRIFRYKQDQVRRNGVARMWYHVRQTERLVRQIHAADPVHVVSGHSPLQMLGAIRCLGQQTPATYTVHSPFDDEMASNRSAGLMNSFAVRLARWADRWIVANCKSVQHVSAYTLRSMTAKHGQSVLQKGVVALVGWRQINFTPRPIAVNYDVSWVPHGMSICRCFLLCGDWKTEWASRHWSLHVNSFDRRDWNFGH